MAVSHKHQGSMSRFNSEIKLLEQQLKKYQKELQQLNEENASLKQREEGLCRSLVTLQVCFTLPLS